MTDSDRGVIIAGVILWLLWRRSQDNSVMFPDCDVTQECPDGSTISICETCPGV